MQSMQRSFGKLLNRGPGDNAKVSILLKEYDDTEQVLEKVMSLPMPPPPPLSPPTTPLPCHCHSLQHIKHFNVALNTLNISLYTD
jgi:hypothetical protein